jgi:PAS domain S-box-containing protein
MKPFNFMNLIQTIKDAYTPIFQENKIIELNNSLKEKVKEKTRELDNKNKELERYFNTMLDGFVTADADTKRLLSCNKAFEKLTGYTEEELKTFTIDKIHPKDSLPYVLEQFEKFAQGEIKVAHSIPVLHKNGKDITICDIGASSSQKDGRRISMGIFRDISDRIELENELKELNENLEIRVSEELEKNRQKELQLFEQSKMAAIGDMIANIAHQWRQPLSVISTSASGLLFQKEFSTLEDKLLIKSLKGINENAKYLSETIDTFRDFIKEEKKIKEVIVQDRIDKALNIVDSALKNSHIKLINNIDYEEPIKLTLVVGELAQVIINIINNAKDIILEKNIKEGWIEIDLLKKENFITITIEDNGGGIPDKILPKIFEPYFSTKHQSKGTGLGLHMSYQIIVNSLKGSIYANNTQNGAKFFIELPYSAEDQELTAQ